MRFTVPMTDVQNGTKLVADGYFDCIEEGAVLAVETKMDGSLCVKCSSGWHNLDGQINDETKPESYVGFKLHKG